MQTSLNLNVDIQKVSDISTKNNNSQKNKSVDTDNKFNDYLQKEKKVNETQKNDTANNDTKNISKNDNESNTDNQVENSKETDEKVEKLSKDDILICLQALVNALNQATESNMAMNEKVDIINKLNSSISDGLINALNLNQNNLESVTNITANINNNSNANLDPATLINNLLQLLNTTNAGELLDQKSLTISESLLKQLGLKLDDNTNLMSNANGINAADEKSFINELINEVKDKINALNSNGNKEVLNSDNINKLIISKENVTVTNEDGTNNTSEKANTLTNQISTNDKSNNSSEYESKKDSNSNFSKDEKVLKSILGEDNKETSKLSMFTMNTAPKVNTEAIKDVQVINKNNMAADVVKSVKFMTSSDMKEMIVKVNPGNLGEITIKLIEQDGNMKLSIKASAKDTYNLLSQQTAEIKNHLSNQNIKIQEVNIGVYEDDTTFFKDGEFQNNFSQEENRRGNSQTNTTRESYLEDETFENEAEDISNINMLA
ncbi:flagellar hook-length control protein FliK [Clostridium sp. SHJSY1]|uniref:flagellar hook-length control protein FliK n=1 Tax=Clostridium sp. SHJSY1 TaxID=2942483 RepID=UPI002874A083|nr:flagellar hook-length control protein FliK [Clostridium sp. SHJSY1]MDS0524104.1 flagellar hook-length control protein FliK [Clostridium sp. SHJSY1]